MNEDPYAILGIPQNTTDEKLIKKAYKIKSHYLDPKKTNNTTKREWDLLNRAYVYLKKKNMAMEEQISINNDHPHRQQQYDSKMQQIEQMQKQRQDQIEQLQKHQSHPKYLPRLEPKVEKTGKLRRIDEQEAFGRYLNKSKDNMNSMIRERQFDADAAYNEMMKHRPKSTKYSDLLNESFDKTDQLDLNIVPWGGFDTDQTASIVDDGNIMVIHEANSLHFDNSTDLANDFDNIYSYDRTNQSGGKMSKGEFSRQMRSMENDFSKTLKFEQEKNKKVLLEHFDSTMF